MLFITHRISRLLAIITSLAPVSTLAHEFWIDPQAYQVAPGTPIVADIRVGQDFKGSANAFLPQRIERFEIITGRRNATAAGRIGDRPALNQVAPEGLAVIVHETKDSELTYRQWDKFVAFNEEKALGGIARHRARGLPETEFRESYRRYAKSLVSVGDGGGADAPVGLRTEIIALANPYTDDLTKGLPVRVLLEGMPRAFAQVKAFERAPSDEVTRSVYQTDAQGIAWVSVQAGHVYQLDAVVLIEGETGGVAWHSLWANLTFAVPD
ncbi:MAG: DUF4198 domain-containing protein [Pseudomonadota bacterium]